LRRPSLTQGWRDEYDDEDYDDDDDGNWDVEIGCGCPGERSMKTFLEEKKANSLKTQARTHNKKFR